MKLTSLLLALALALLHGVVATIVAPGPALAEEDELQQKRRDHGDSRRRLLRAKKTNQSLQPKDYLKDFRNYIRTPMPTHSPTLPPSHAPTRAPTEKPTTAPTSAPTPFPTSLPTDVPTDSPTLTPSHVPTDVPPTTLTAMPTLQPTGTFECGGEQTSQAIDIVIAMDESLSMEDEQQDIRDHVNTLFQRIDFETNGRFRMALVGYTGPWLTDGQGNDIGPVAVDPELKTALTNDQTVFEQAVDNLTVDKRNRENTKGTLLKIVQNQIQDLSGEIVPLAGDAQFPSERGFCALAITDEGNQPYQDFPDPGNDAVIEAYQNANSVIFMVSPSGTSGLRLIAEETGGDRTLTGEFRNNPGPTIERIVEKCVVVLCEPN